MILPTGGHEHESADRFLRSFKVLFCFFECLDHFLIASSCPITAPSRLFSIFQEARAFSLRYSLSWNAVIIATTSATLSFVNSWRSVSRRFSTPLWLFQDRPSAWFPISQAMLRAQNSVSVRRQVFLSRVVDFLLEPSILRHNYVGYMHPSGSSSASSALSGNYGRSHTFSEVYTSLQCLVSVVTL